MRPTLPLPLVVLLLAPALLTGALAQAEDDAGPRAFFEIADATVATGRTVRVDASDSRPGPDATNITEYAWRWIEGGEFEALGPRANHSYRVAGVHVITLRVTDDAGGVGFVNQSVLVEGSLPTPYFTLSYKEVDGALEATVNARSSRPSRGADEIVRYEWNWGDGSGFVEGNVTETHVYEEPGQYTITLRVTDDEGRSDTTNEFIIFESTFFTRLLKVGEQWPAFLAGARLTLLLAIGTTFFGFFLAVVLALMRISTLWFVRVPASWYIEIIRGTPLFVQILIAWLVLPVVGITLPALYAGALALIVNTSAYQAEAIRGGIQSIPTGQMEAATGLGMTYMQAMRFVIVPQAFRLTLPPLGNEFIILLKDTSLLSVIGVFELTQVGRIFSANTFLVLETWVGVAAIYFLMTYSISLGLRHLEKRLAIPGLGMGGGGH